MPGWKRAAYVPIKTRPVQSELRIDEVVRNPPEAPRMAGWRFAFPGLSVIGWEGGSGMFPRKVHATYDSCD